MELQILGSKTKKLELSDDVYGVEYNRPLVHQVVTAFMSAGRAGTHAQKTRSEVSGGGIKPWRQKGTGRARAGTIRSPIWRKGGVTFAAKPRDYSQKVNRKMYRGAIKAIFSELIRLERFHVVENLNVESHKSKDLLTQLAKLKLGVNVLIIADAVDENLYLASRNLPHVEVRDVAAVDPVSLIKSEKVLITSAAAKQFEELLK